MFNVIVFSKDRPCQLDLLLRSWKAMATGATPTVLRLASDADVRRGYKLCESYHPGVTQIDEQDFRQDILSLLLRSRQFTMFLMDDMLIRKPLDLQHPLTTSPLHADDVLCVSLRLAPHIRYSFSNNRPCRTPKFNDYTEWLEWDWRPHKRRGEWGYPMGLDGHIFRTSELLDLMCKLSWSSPNSLEDQLSRQPLPQPLMACFRDGPYTMNVPLNRVQDQYPNRTCDGPSATELNQAFIAGKRIAMDPLLTLPITSCHMPAEIEWEDE